MTIYNRFDPARQHEKVLFRADRVLQSAELNEMQSMQQHRLKGLADVLFKEGDIVQGCACIVHADTGAATLAPGQLYAAGAVRTVAPAALTLATVGVVNVGAYLQTRTVDELQDPSLNNPAAGTRGHGEPGAAREVVELVWGVQGDGTPGTFYPVWVVDNGMVRPKELPPTLDGVNQAIARYDRDSAGGSYIVNGLRVAMATDLATGEQVYTVDEGRARVAGYGVEMQAGRRLVFDAVPDLLTVDSEPHQSTTEGAQRINVGRPPMLGQPQVRINARKTVTLTHGGFSGAADPLPDASVIQIESVQQGATTFTPTSDYKLAAGQVDWSPAGAEPLPGSSYDVTYQYVLNAPPTDVDAKGFTVAGALTGSLVLVTYAQQLRRIDRLCLTREGAFEWLRGVSSPWMPTAPVVPEHMLCLASVYQTWDQDRRVANDGVKVVPMQQLVGERERLDDVIMDLAELRLATSAQGLDSGVKKGLFADPFLSDNQRDAGLAQTAAVVRGTLQLPLAPTAHPLGRGISERLAPAHGYRVALAQTMRTGSMQVNPYMAFDPIPAAITLQPNVDRWTEVVTQWESALTERLYTGSGSTSSYAGASTTTKVLSETASDLEYLRPIEVGFTVAGFGPSEPLATVTFDGIVVAAQPLAGAQLVADALGQLAGTFTIPGHVTAGTKAVDFAGAWGSRGAQTFMGQGTQMLRTQQQTTTQTWVQSNPPPAISTGGAVFGPSGAGSSATQNQSQCSKWLYDGYFDPLAQTFVLDETLQCAGLDLWFTAKSGPVVVQIRETSNGVPTQAVLVETRISAAQIQLAGATRITWVPTLLQAQREYAIVVLCDDATTALAIAELGKQDPAVGYVTSQPYQVGMLLSSSNASTWTPHQDRDMAFQLLAAQFTETARVIDLGTADLVGATDLMVLGFAERPSADANLTFEVQLPPALDNEVIRLTDGQVVWLAAPFTGQVQVRARITGNASAAAVLGPGVQLIAAQLGAQGTYITRTLRADSSSRVKVVYEGDIPGGSAVQVHVQADDRSGPWVLVPYLTASTNTAGVREITHELEDFNAGTGCRVRLTLTGGTTARPVVRNLRVVVL